MARDGRRSSGTAGGRDAEVVRLEAELQAATGRLKALEAQKGVSEGRFGIAQQLAGIGIWDWDLETGETWWSPVVYELWGLPQAETAPSNDDLPVHPEDRATLNGAAETARESGQLDLEWRVILPSGEVRWLSAVGRLDASEGRRRILGVTQDITLRRRTEARLTLLLGELQHRVRNILGVVRSIVARTVRSASSLEDLASHLDGRLDALGRTQGVFARTHAGAVDLEDMIRDELVAAAAREDQITVEGPPVRLKRVAAESFALTIHELTTNAIKYGALAEPLGKVAVNWRLLGASGGARLRLEWRESGVRALDIKPSRSGFGRELIERGLPYELGATTTLEFGRGGVRAMIEMPLTDKTAELDDGDPGEAAG